MTGAGTTASRLGEPDLGVATVNDFVENGGMIVRVAKDVPVICDADTGFGGPINIARTVELYERAGIAALHIEDQGIPLILSDIVIPKRCGHLLGKTVVSQEEYTSRISAACLAKSSQRSAPLIICRTDAVQPLGLDEAISRMKQCYKIGAEIAFVEGILNEHDARKITSALHPMPCLINLATNGNTPNWTVKQCQEMGFRVVIFPCTGFCSVVHALRKAYSEVILEGTDVKACQGMSPKEFFEVVGLKEAMEIDAKAGGIAYNALK